MILSVSSLPSSVRVDVPVLVCRNPMPCTKPWLYRLFHPMMVFVQTLLSLRETDSRLLHPPRHRVVPVASWDRTSNTVAILCLRGSLPLLLQEADGAFDHGPDLCIGSPANLPATGLTINRSHAIETSARYFKTSEVSHHIPPAICISAMKSGGCPVTPMNISSKIAHTAPASNRAP